MANAMYWYSLAIRSNSIFCNYDAYQTFGKTSKLLSFPFLKNRISKMILNGEVEIFVFAVIL